MCECVCVFWLGEAMRVGANLLFYICKKVEGAGFCALVIYNKTICVFVTYITAINSF